MIMVSHEFCDVLKTNSSWLHLIVQCGNARVMYSPLVFYCPWHCLHTNQGRKNSKYIFDSIYLGYSSSSVSENHMCAAMRSCNAVSGLHEEKNSSVIFWTVLKHPRVQYRAKFLRQCISLWSCSFPASKAVMVGLDTRSGSIAFMGTERGTPWAS